MQVAAAHRLHVPDALGRPGQLRRAGDAPSPPWWCCSFALTGVAPAEVIAARALNTVIGGIIALAAYRVWPTWERTLVPEALARLLDAYRAYFQAIRDAYRRSRPGARSRLPRAPGPRSPGRPPGPHHPGSLRRAPAHRTRRPRRTPHRAASHPGQLAPSHPRHDGARSRPLPQPAGPRAPRLPHLRQQRRFHPVLPRRLPARRPPSTPATCPTFAKTIAPCCNPATPTSNATNWSTWKPTASPTASTPSPWRYVHWVSSQRIVAIGCILCCREYTVAKTAPVYRYRICHRWPPPPSLPPAPRPAPARSS